MGKWEERIWMGVIVVLALGLITLVLWTVATGLP